MNNDVFCSLPFTEIFLGPDGKIKTCCSARHVLGSLHSNTIEEILEGKKAKEIRQHILDGKWHEQCIQCKQQEEQGVRSERSANKNFVENTSEKLTSDFFKLRRLDLRWSNTCNLACIYCYEYFSSKWADIKGLKVNTIKEENEEGLFKFIEKNVKESPLSDSIIMLGGEPLLQKQNLRLIETLSGSGFYVLTNFSVPLQTNKIAQKLLKEKACHWGISFETVGDRYEYVRNGASWKIFEENVDYYNKIKENSQWNLEAHSLYSIYSAFNLVEFYQFILDKDFKNVFWNLLESSGNNVNVNVLNMSTKLKHKAIIEIEKCQEMFPGAPGLEFLIDIKHSLIKETNNEVNDKNIVEDIENLEKQINKTTNTFKDLWPNVYREII